jgi:hypothetical protein
MPQVPQITLTATLQDAFGNTDVGAQLRITLAGFGGIMPRVNGTSMLSRAQQKAKQVAGVPISVTIFGNDVITPGPSLTFYCIEIFDSKNNIVQSGNYQLNGAGAIDLSTLNQYFPPPPPVIGQSAVITNPPGGALQTINGSITIVGNLIVTGTISNNALVTVASSAAPLFDGALGGSFKMVLTSDTVLQNVVNMANKLVVPIMLIQDGTGGHAFTWAGNTKNGGFVNPGPNARSVQMFFPDTDGTLYQAAPMVYS